MRRFILIGLLLLAGCSTPTPVVISGNGQCHPSQDLPSHKDMKKVPEANISLEDFFGLFANERKDHASDIRDYNSLFDQCVAK